MSDRCAVSRKGAGLVFLQVIAAVTLLSFGASAQDRPSSAIVARSELTVATSAIIPAAVIPAAEYAMSVGDQSAGN
jgi:hypothetical protein